MITKLTDKEIENIWNNMEDIPFDEIDSEMILAEDYYVWQQGEDRDTIWHWFDENHSRGVAYLLNEYEV